METVDVPTGLVPCKKTTWSRQILAGVEHNEFEWSIVHITGEPTEPSYCLEVPTQMKQNECKDVQDKRTWRSFGTAGDATEISVKPAATLQIVTDPEVLFQFYLFSKEGKSSRILRSRMAGLLRNAENLRRFIQNTLKITQEAYNVLDTVSSPIGAVNGHLSEGHSTFSLFNRVIYPLELVPYLGKLLKALRLKTITGQVAKHMKVCAYLFINNIKCNFIPISNMSLIHRKVKGHLIRLMIKWKNSVFL